MLNRIFDDSTSTSEREAAIAALKRITGKDRAGLVEKYTRSSPWVVTRSDVTAAIENITLKMEVSTLKSGRSMAESDLLRLVFSLCGQDRDLYDEVHRNTGLIAATGAKMPDLLKGLRYLIDSGVPRRPAYEPPYRHRGQAAPKHAPRTEAKPKNGKRWEIIAPARLYEKPAKRIEDVCAGYGLELVPTTEVPKFPDGYPKWRPSDGKLFTTTCPQCRGVMHVSTLYQRWTCSCDRRFPSRKEHAPDVVGLVEHLTACGYYNAVWWVIGTGHQPKMASAPPAS